MCVNIISLLGRSLCRPHDASSFREVVVGWLAFAFSHSFSDVSQGCSWGQPTQLQHRISIVDVVFCERSPQGVRRESALTNCKNGLDLMRKSMVGDADVGANLPQNRIEESWRVAQTGTKSRCNSLHAVSHALATLSTSRTNSASAHPYAPAHQTRQGARLNEEPCAEPWCRNNAAPAITTRNLSFLALMDQS